MSFGQSDGFALLTLGGLPSMHVGKAFTGQKP